VSQFHSPLMTEMLMQNERDLMLAEFEHMRRHHQLPEELATGSGGIRCWFAARLAGIALRLDRPAAEGALST
jgi:hypothetical protein